MNNLELKFVSNHLLLLVSPKGSSDKMVKMVKIGDKNIYTNQSGLVHLSSWLSIPQSHGKLSATSACAN